jgi:hypothetical protein
MSVIGIEPSAEEGLPLIHVNALDALFVLFAVRLYPNVTKVGLTKKVFLSRA